MLISVKSIRKLCDPTQNDVWSCGIVAQSLVAQCIQQGRLIDHEEWEALNAEALYIPSAEEHASRIAYLATEGWEDPIEIDVGVPSLGYFPKWPLEDGNHRLFAAIFKKHETIDATFAGDLDLVSELFGITV